MYMRTMMDEANLVIQVIVNMLPLSTICKPNVKMFNGLMMNEANPVIATIGKLFLLILRFVMFIFSIFQ